MLTPTDHPGPGTERPRRRARRPRPRPGRQRLRDARGSRSPGLDPWRLGGEMWGWYAAGVLTSLCYAGANLVPDLRHPRGRTRPSPTAPAGPAAAARPSSAPRDATAELWSLLEPSWGPAREVRAHQPLMATDRMPADIAPGPASPPRPQGRDGPDHAGVRGDVHRGGRRLAARRRRRAALPGPGRRTRRHRPVLRPHRGRQGRLQGGDRRRHRPTPARSRACGSAPGTAAAGCRETGMAAVLRYALARRRAPSSASTSTTSTPPAAPPTAGSASRRSARS